MKVRTSVWFVAVATVVSVAACGRGGGGGDDGPALVSIALTPPDPTIGLSTSLQFTATATYEDTSTQVVTTSAAWGSSSPNVATIDVSGLAVALAVGETTIGVTLDTVLATTLLTVSSGGGPTGEPATLNFSGTAWTQHVGQVPSVRILEGATVVWCTQGAAIPVGGNWTVSSPNLLVGGTAYTYETFADGNSNGVFDAGGIDHRWRGAFSATAPTTAVTVPHAQAEEELTWTDGAGCPGR